MGSVGQKIYSKVGTLIADSKEAVQKFKTQEATDTNNAWITDIEGLCNQIDKIGLTAVMTDYDYMFHVMGN